MKKRAQYLLIAIIIFLGIIPRTIELFSLSNYFGSEQGVEYVVTKKIVVDHELVLTAHQGGFGGFLKPAGFNYVLAIPFILTSGNPFGGRVFMMFLSVLVLIVAYIVGIRIFDFKTSFFVVSLLAFSPNLSHYAGRISPPFIIPLITVLLIFFLFKAFKNNRLYIPIIAFTIGITAHFEMATTGKLGGIFFIILVYLIISKRIYFYTVLLTFFVFLVPLLPLFIYDLSHNFQNINGIIKMFSAGVNHTAEFSSSKLMTILLNRVEVFKWNFMSTFSPHFLIWPVTLGWVIAGSYIYIRKIKKYSSQKFIFILLLLVPVVSLLLLIFYPGFIVQWWLLEFVVGYCFLLGIIFGFLWKIAATRLLIVLTMIVFFASFMSRTYMLYKHEFRYPYSVDMYIREIEPIKFIFEDAKDKPFNLRIFSNNSQANYEYLLWWYGERSYFNKPSDKTEDVAYLLVENNITNTLLYKNFIGTNDKKLLTTKKYGEFTVTKWRNK